MLDALPCQRLPVALRNAGIHPSAVLSAPLHPLPSFPETFDSLRWLGNTTSHIYFFILLLAVAKGILLKVVAGEQGKQK